MRAQAKESSASSDFLGDGNLVNPCRFSWPVLAPVKKPGSDYPIH